jgi:hypothetical protein
MRYKAVYSAHQECVRALNEAQMSGGPTAPNLVEKEARVREELAVARAALLAAMARTAGEPTSA